MIEIILSSSESLSNANQLEVAPNTCRENTMTSNSDDFNKTYQNLLLLLQSSKSKDISDLTSQISSYLNSRKSDLELCFDALILASYHINLNDYRNFKELIENQRLFKDCQKYVDFAHSIVSNSSTDLVFFQNKNNLCRICFVSELVYGVTSLNQLTFDLIITIYSRLRALYKLDRKLKKLQVPLLVLVKSYDLQNTTNYLEKIKSIINRIRILSVIYFLNEHQQDQALKYKNWTKYFEEWVSKQSVKTISKYEQAFTHLLAHLIINEYADEPIEHLKNKQSVDLFDNLVQVDVKSKNYILQSMNRFSLFIIDTYLEGTGKPLATTTQIDQINAHENKTKKKLSETSKEILPTHWAHMCSQILTENDNAWPKSLGWQYFKRENPETGENEDVFSPVAMNLYLLLLQVPIRKIQAQQLDSGEGDSEHFNMATMSWEINRSRHANYWKNLRTLRDDRGVVTKFISEGKVMAGLYINTNKVQDVKNGFDETSGFFMPWYHLEAITIISKMRVWQECFNPINQPTGIKEIPRNCWPSRLSEFALESIPARFYLFRNPLGKTKGAPTPDQKLFKFWYFLMDELERRLNAKGENIKLVLTRTKSGEPKSAVFTPHGLRAYGLTALSKNGVPLEYLSKLVAGHATILMTLHYIKFNHGEISNILNNARNRADELAKDSFLNLLNSSNYEQAKSFAIINSIDALKQHQKNYDMGGKTNYSGSAIGLCPVNGTGCHNGGEIIRKNGNKKEDDYGPVEGGPNNCSRCRHLITGSPWLINLWLEGNKKLKESQSASSELDGLYKTKTDLEVQHQKEIYKPQPDIIEIKNLNNQIRNIFNTIELKTKILDELLNTAHAIHNLISQINSIPNNDEDEEKFSIIVHPEGENPLEYAATSKLEALNLLVQAGDLYVHIADENLRRERDEFVNEVLFNCGLKPISFSALTPQQKKKAMNDASNFLLATLTRTEMIQLENGEVTLKDLGLINSVKTAMKAIAPIPGLNLSKPNGPSLT